MHYYTDVLKKYAQFEGRASRKEYWMFVLANIIIGFVIGIIEGIVKLSSINLLADIYGLAILIPSIAVSVRRLHDIGWSGWWVLLGIIPFIGAIILIVLYCLDSQPGDNKYGPNPKGVMAPQMAQTPQNPNTPNPMM
jgi:uncharacterized membrane protein YhaH (DUF805 family)